MEYPWHIWVKSVNTKYNITPRNANSDLCSCNIYIYIHIRSKVHDFKFDEICIFVQSRQRLPPHKYTNRAGLLALYTETSVTVSSGLISRRSLTIICYIIGIMAEFISCLQRMQGAVSIRKTVLPGMAIPMLKIRRPNGRLIFNMQIAIRR